MRKSFIVDSLQRFMVFSGGRRNFLAMTVVELLAVRRRHGGVGKKMKIMSKNKSKKSKGLVFIFCKIKNDMEYFIPCGF